MDLVARSWLRTFRVLSASIRDRQWVRATHTTNFVSIVWIKYAASPRQVTFPGILPSYAATIIATTLIAASLSRISRSSYVVFVYLSIVFSALQVELTSLRLVLELDISEYVAYEFAIFVIVRSVILMAVMIALFMFLIVLNALITLKHWIKCIK